MFIIIMYAPNCLNDTLLHDESYSLLGLLICADPPYGDKTAPGQRSESWAQRLLDEPALPQLLAPEGRLLLGHTKRDVIELAEPWRERKTLKHGDTWIRILEV